MVTSRKKFTSDICIDGKRINVMRQLAQTAFEESFISIEIKDGRFIIHIKDDVPEKKLKTFLINKPLCKIIPYKERTLKDICTECK